MYRCVVQILTRLKNIHWNELRFDVKIFSTVNVSHTIEFICSKGYFEMQISCALEYCEPLRYGII